MVGLSAFRTKPVQNWLLLKKISFNHHIKLIVRLALARIPWGDGYLLVLDLAVDNIIWTSRLSNG